MDLKFLLDDLFADEIKALIISYEERCIDKLDKIIKEDRFLVVSSQSLGTDVKVTASVVSFYNILIKFVNEACLLVKLPVRAVFPIILKCKALYLLTQPSPIGSLALFYCDRKYQ